MCACVWWQARCSCEWYKKSKMCRWCGTVGGLEIERELSVTWGWRGDAIGTGSV